MQQCYVSKIHIKKVLLPRVSLSLVIAIKIPKRSQVDHTKLAAATLARLKAADHVKMVLKFLAKDDG